jgi:hypothetical protein
VLRRFSPDLDVPIASRPDVPLVNTGVTEIEGGWKFTSTIPRVFSLFTFDARGLSRGMMIYRAVMRSRDAGSAAYLELWCRVPGQGSFFVKGTHQIVKGYQRWRQYEIPYYLPTVGRAADVTLNVTFDQPGAVEMRRIELFWRDVPGFLDRRHFSRNVLSLSWRLLRFAVLGALNVVLIVGQLVLLILSEVLGHGILTSDKVFTWWPKTKRPMVGKMAG